MQALEQIAQVTAAHTHPDRSKALRHISRSTRASVEAHSCGLTSPDDMPPCERAEADASEGAEKIIPQRLALTVLKDQKLRRYRNAPPRTTGSPLTRSLHHLLYRYADCNRNAGDDLRNDAAITLRLVRASPYNRFGEKGFGGRFVAPRGQAKVDHLTTCTNCTPQMTPLGTGAMICLAHMPVDSRRLQVFLVSSGPFRPDYLCSIDQHPVREGPIHRRSIMMPCPVIT